MSLETIEQLAKKHAERRALLAERVQALTDEIESAKRRKLAGIKSALSSAKDSELELLAAVRADYSQFDRPRSRVFHGLKIGFQKAKGKLSFGDVDNVVALIRKHFPDQFDVLVKTEHKPIKASLQSLPAGDLKRIGCTITETGDEAFVKPIDGDVEKLVDALLEDKSDEDEGRE